jgi:phage host-nuclease inhibitor protein Gam
MARVKPTETIPVLKSLEDVNTALARLAELRRNVALIETDMNAEIDRIKGNAYGEAEPYHQQISSLDQALARYADYNKAEIFTRKKSLELAFGIIGYRASSKIKLLAKRSWEQVLQTLHDHARGDLIRVKEEPDKEKMKGLSTEYLKEIGCKVIQEDVFYYELAEQALQDVPANIPQE